MLPLVPNLTFSSKPKASYSFFLSWLSISFFSFSSTLELFLCILFLALLHNDPAEEEEDAEPLRSDEGCP